MKLFVVLGCVNWEGSTILGIFSTYKKAKNFVSNFNNNIYSSINIVEKELNNGKEY